MNRLGYPGHLDRDGRWHPPVPYVNPAFLATSVFFYVGQGAAESGDPRGGSGFLVGLSDEDDPNGWVHLYAVTNDHVRVGAPFARLQNGLGDRTIEGGPDGAWHAHPEGDDVALLYLGFRPRQYSYFPARMLVSRGDIVGRRISSGDNCMMIGRYVGPDSLQFDEPVLRFGNIGLCPPGTIWQGDRQFDQESFLVDMRSHGGYSGSPVVVYTGDMGFRPGAVIAAAGPTWLLGVDWGHLHFPVDLLQYDSRDHGSRETIGTVQAGTGMAAVVPGWKVTEVLELEECVEERTASERQRKSHKAAEGAVMDSVDSEEEATSIDKTRDLMGNLLQVPRDEVRKGD